MKRKAIKGNIEAEVIPFEKGYGYKLTITLAYSDSPFKTPDEAMVHVAKIISAVDETCKTEV